MSTPEQARLAAAQGGDSSVISARAEREQRISADIEAMAAGHAPGHDQQTMHFGGAPSPATQMVTHGQPAPSVPDEGGHASASDRIG